MGVYSDLDACLYCKAPCYHEDGSPRRQFTTIPIGPILQAFYSSPQTAEEMHYRERRLTEIAEYVQTHNGQMEYYDNTACSYELLQAWASGWFTKDDIMLQLSIDGAQLAVLRQSLWLLDLHLDYPQLLPWTTLQKILCHSGKLRPRSQETSRNRLLPYSLSPPSCGYTTWRPQKIQHIYIRNMAIHSCHHHRISG